MTGYDEDYKRRVAEERARRRNSPPPQEPEISHSESPFIPPPSQPSPEIPVTPPRLYRDSGGAG